MKYKRLPIPQLNLNQEFEHQVPEQHAMELVIEFKRKGSEREFLNPIDIIVVKDGLLRVKNRNVPYVYNYPLNEIRTAYFIPMEITE